MKKSTVIWVWGLGTSVVSILFYQLLYATGQDDSPVRWFNVLILFLGLFIGTLQFRNKANGGYLTFGEGFKAGFLMLLIIAVLSTIASVVNLELHPEYIDRIIAQARDNMINKGYTDEQIQAGMKMTKVFTSAPLLTLFTLIGVLFFGAILSLITAGLCSRNKPLFDNDTETSGNVNPDSSSQIQS